MTLTFILASWSLIHLNAQRGRSVKASTFVRMAHDTHAFALIGRKSRASLGLRNTNTFS